MKKNYIVAKKQNNGEITFINYNKMDGFKVTPRNSVEYPGIEVNSILLIKPSFIEKVLKRKNKIKLNYYLNYIIEESDDDSSDMREVLDNIERYKGIIEYKYRKYLDDKYINLLNKKLGLVEKKIKAKLIYKELELQQKQFAYQTNDLTYEDSLEETRGKSR